MLGQGDPGKLISVVDIFKDISDYKSLVLFNTVALSNGESDIHIRKSGLTSKEYYSRLSKMIKVDLIRRRNGRYSLTALGKIVYDAHMTIGKALNYYWKLRTIESIEMSSSTVVSKEDLSKLIDLLIDNQEIKDMIVKPLLANNATIRDYGHQQYNQRQSQQEQKEELGLEKLMISK